MTALKVAFAVSKNDQAQQAYQTIKNSYVETSLEAADIIISLGGDGFMLRVLHKILPLKKPVFGMNCGSVGFLMNTYHEKNLLERIEKAHTYTLNPLIMTAKDIQGKMHKSHAINEVSLFRKSAMAAHVGISVDGQCHLEKLVCDGAIVSTPAGSTAYNLSAHGPIIPLGGNILALTPISAFRPRRWKGALIPHTSTVTFNVLDPENRPISAVADFHEIHNVAHVEISSDPTESLQLLFDPEENLEHRILKEQFLS